jgi:uncharacterized membrane protein
MTTLADAAPPPPVIRSITAEDVYAALDQGWQDFRAVPRFGLFFGGIYALVGIALFLTLWAGGRPAWIVPLAVGFPLVGPFVAVGLYEVSRRRERGERLDWAEVLGAVWRKRDSQIPSMAFVVLAGLLVWMWAASMLVIIFLGRLGAYRDLDAILSSENGIALVVVGTVVGGIIAFVLFALTVVSLPMLVDREIDIVTAMVTSFRAVTSNLQPMLHWAWIVGGVLFVAMLPLFLGLVVALPVLGHATWHLYRKVIAPL